MTTLAAWRISLIAWAMRWPYSSRLMRGNRKEKRGNEARLPGQGRGPGARPRARPVRGMRWPLEARQVRTPPQGPEMEGRRGHAGELQGVLHQVPLGSRPRP